MNIFVSSVAFNNLSIPDIEQLAIEHNLSVEFSANFDPNLDLHNQFQSLKIDRLPHNYFPPPKNPFVLNLASQNKEILELSRKHCIQGIELATICRLKYYSAHAGFCLDPTPDSLGKRLVQPKHIDREIYWNTFIESCHILSDVANKKGVKFLIENNVLMEANLRTDEVNPLLCVDSDEILKIFDVVNNEAFGFLLDTAHLKVSALSLGFDMEKVVEKLIRRIDYIHHSDNDGKSDSNQPLTEEYWFLKYMNNFKAIPHVVEVKNQSLSDLKKQISLLKLKQ